MERGGSGADSDAPHIDDMICRDFLRDVCRRGMRCKFKHPTKEEASNLGLKKPVYQFCHDYQNSTCRRSNCKFVHCSREEEEYYLKNGDLPDRLKAAVEMGIPLNEPLEDIDIPVCKDFLKRQCDRGTRCKYRHLSMAEYEEDLERKMKRKAVQAFGAAFNPMGQTPADICNDMVMAKRQRFDMNMGMPGNTMPPMVNNMQKAQEENVFLKSRLEELHKQINALQASNELLVQQNTRVRLGGQQLGGQQQIPSSAAPALW